jgi:YlmC/YmxH family sporulation protein
MLRMTFFMQFEHFPRQIHIVIRDEFIQKNRIRGDYLVKISDFQSKDVINIVDGKKLGQVSDLELDLRQGRIDSIVVPSTQGKFFGFFGGGTDVVIPWKNIVKIGLDVVLVKLDDTRIYRSAEEGESVQDYSRPSRDR